MARAVVETASEGAGKVGVAGTALEVVARVTVTVVARTLVVPMAGSWVANSEVVAEMTAARSEVVAVCVAPRRPS